MSLALLFPGQGVQHAGMLPWLDEEPLAAPVLAALNARLGQPWRSCLADPAQASSNRVAQLVLTGSALATWAALAPRLPRPAMLAGYSVGELAAFSTAGLFDAHTALQLAEQRALAMDACATAQPEGLLAFSGLRMDRVAPLCERFGVGLAIRLAGDRGVLGGLQAALHALTPALLDQGAELTPLRVQVASHTAAMAPAAAAFERLLQPMAWPRATAVLVCNLDGAGRRDPAGLKQALARQIDHTVLWDRCLATLAERQPRCVLEVGPGNTLSRMWAGLHADVPARSCDEFQSAASLLAWVQRHTDAGP